jgi:hypothetical protein
VSWLEEVLLDFLEVHGLRAAVTAVRVARKRCVVATPRVLKPGEERLAAFYLRLGADALLLRSTGLLWQLTQGAGGWAGSPWADTWLSGLEMNTRMAYLIRMCRSICTHGFLKGLLSRDSSLQCTLH